MNAIDLQELDPADRAFALAASARLRASESLNYVEAARLAATRAQARELLSQPRGAIPAWGWLAAPAAVAAIAVSLVRFEPAAPLPEALPTAEALIELSAAVNAPAADALVWVSDEAGPDFYRDLEFYQWLQSRSPSEPNA